MAALRMIANRSACLLLLLSGCFPSKLLEAPGRPIPPPAPSKTVKIGGRGLDLGESQPARVHVDEFLSKTADLLNNGRQHSARLWVERHPDVALDALRSGAAAGSPAWQFVAGVHDQQCGHGESGWLAILRDRVTHPDRYAAYDKARKQFWEKAQVNKPDEALALHLTDLAKFQPLLLIDAWHLHGNAHLVANRPTEAEAAFRKGIQLCGQGHPYAAVHLMLVQSEALRRCEKYEEANATWLKAVELAAPLLDGDRPACDPILWERASYLRPVSTPWPTAIADRLGRISQAGISANGQPADEALIWCGIGKMRLERGESQSALVAYKRAESMTSEAGLRAGAQLGQAQALLQLEQQPSAIAILAPLTNESDGRIAAGALALVGAARYHGGSAPQAIGFLRKALEKAGTADWSGRADAEADLALVYLTLGHEKEGLELLHAAQQRYEADRRFLPLRQSLLNEQEYYTRKKKPEEAERIQQKLEAMEAS